MKTVITIRPGPTGWQARFAGSSKWIALPFALDDNPGKIGVYFTCSPDGRTLMLEAKSQRKEPYPQGE